MVFRKADLENTLPSKHCDAIMELYKKGYSCRGIVRELAKIGIQISKDTVSRRIKERIQK